MSAKEDKKTFGPEDVFFASALYYMEKYNYDPQTPLKSSEKKGSGSPTFASRDPRIRIDLLKNMTSPGAITEERYLNSIERLLPDAGEADAFETLRRLYEEKAGI